MQLEAPSNPHIARVSTHPHALRPLEELLGSLHAALARIFARMTEWARSRQVASDPREALSARTLADANAMLGNGYLQSGHYDDAIEALSRAIGHDPEFAKAYFLLGMARSCKGEYLKAIGHYSQAIALRADKASYYFSRARAYEALRQPQHAMEDYGRVLMLDPEHHGARCCYRTLKDRYPQPLP